MEYARDYWSQTDELVLLSSDPEFKAPSFRLEHAVKLAVADKAAKSVRRKGQLPWTDELGAERTENYGLEPPWSDVAATDTAKLPLKHLPLLADNVVESVDRCSSCS